MLAQVLNYYWMYICACCCMQYSTWRVTCRCIVHCWSCCVPLLSAHHWCLCCCHLTVMTILQCPSAPCWRRWNSVLTHTPADLSMCRSVLGRHFACHTCFSVLHAPWGPGQSPLSLHFPTSPTSTLSFSIFYFSLFPFSLTSFPILLA